LLDKNEGAIRCATTAISPRRASRRPLRFEARYEMPFLAHATMEPPGATISIEKDKALLIASLQSPGSASQ
jgi:isoquinoline 1-oxidoreductase beta subunit